MTLLDSPDVHRRAADQLAELDRRLAEQHHRLLAELRTLTVDGDVSDLLDDDVASGDGTHRETAWLLTRHIADQRAEIAAARRRLADGTYGRCTSCAATISPARLQVLPAAATCVRCAR